jgi:plastocyanin
MHSRLLLVPALAIVATTLAGCPAGTQSTAPAYGGGGGGTTAGPSFDLAFPAPGTSRTWMFADTGSWDYRCKAHPGMTGTVVVTATAATDTALVTLGPSTNTFSPSTVTIKPTTGYVRWVNASAMTIHTVTRP